MSFDSDESFYARESYKDGEAAIEKKIIELEKLALVSTPGTILQKVLVDNKLLIEEGLKLASKESQSQIVWSVGIGGLLQPKVFAHGYTIKEALQRVEKKIKEVRANDNKCI